MSKKKKDKNKNVVRGKFPFKGDDGKKSKKKLRKEKDKLIKQKDKAILMQCECNHLDSKRNKSHFKKTEDGNYKICQICGGKIICNPVALTPECASAAYDTIYTIFAYVRNKVKLSDSADRDITTALRVISRSEELLRMIMDDTADDYGEGKKKKKHGKGKKKHNKEFGHNGEFRREVY